MLKILAVGNRLTFSFIIFIAIMILMLGASSIYGDYADDANTVLGVYMTMLLFTAVKFKAKRSAEQRLSMALPAFLIMFLLTFGIMTLLRPAIQGLLVASTLEASMSLAAAGGLLTAFVKAYVEEDVFRSRLAPLIGEWGQSILFGMFHFFVLFMILGWSWWLPAAIAWLSLLGYVWGRVEDRFGLAGSTASHFAYNIVAMGLGAVLVGGTVV